MARSSSTTKAEPQASSNEPTAFTRMLRAVLWAVLVGAWLLVGLSLLSYDPADPGSLTRGVVNHPPQNWVGGFGAHIAHQTFLIVGPGAWLMLIGIGLLLGLAAAGKRIDQLWLRLIGLVMMALAVSSVVGVVGPSLVEGIAAGPQAPGGLTAMYVNDQMAGRFGVAGTLIILVIGFWIGAVLTADRIVLAIPRAIAVALGGLGYIPSALNHPVMGRMGRALAWLNPIGWIRLGAARILHYAHAHQEAHQAAVAGASTAAEDDVADGPTDADLRAAKARAKHARSSGSQVISEDAGGFAATKSFDANDARAGGSHAGITTSENDDGEVEADVDADAGEADAESAAGSTAQAWASTDETALADGGETANDADQSDDAEIADYAAATPTNRFDPEALRAKMKKLPINFAPKTDHTQDIPREPDFSGYQFPGLDLLEEPESNFTQEMEQIVRDQAVELEGALREYKIEGEVVGIDSGPVITLFEVRLSPGTKVSRLNTVDTDLARAMRAQNIRIVPNMAGKDTVGIEVPNLKKERVRLKELMQADPDSAAEMNLPMFLGKDASGNPMIEDLNAMPHILIAGTTGSGKSVCMNSIIMSFLYTKKPDELKLVLVDPKMVEMSMFKNIPHLMCPVVTEMGKATAILEWAVTKMDERYELLAEAGVRDISDYNELGWEEIKQRMEPATEAEEARIPKKLPYMVFIVDELADLMMTNKEVEASIVRIAQKARAVGIHLILATQRPQANVVTGLIKSNMPGRVAFKVASGMDSRIVLDQKGGELLLGHGDMLFLSPREHKLARAQGTLIGDGEIRRSVKFLKTMAQQNFEPTLVQIKSGDSADDEAEDENEPRDELFEEAVEVVLETRRGSVSLLQRRLTIGYSRSSRIIEQLANAGILGPYKGSQAREVVISEEEWQAMKAQARADADAQAEAGTAPSSEAQPTSAANGETNADSESNIAEGGDQASRSSGDNENSDARDTSDFDLPGQDTSNDDLEGAPAIYEHSHVETDSAVPNELDDEYRQ